MAMGKTDIQFEATGQWFDEFVGVPTNTGLKHEPAFKRTLMSIWHIVKRLEKLGMVPEDVKRQYDLTEEEIRAAVAYYRAFPWRVDLRMEDEEV